MSGRLGGSRGNSSNVGAIIIRTGDFRRLPLIDLLIVPAGDLYVFFSLSRIDHQQPGGAQLTEHGPHIISGQPVLWEYLCLQRQRREFHPAVVVGKIPHSNEQKPRQRVDAEHLFVSPEVRLYGADAGHLFDHP